MAINLLPPEAKKNIRLERIHHIVTFYGELAFVMLILFAAALYAETIFANWELNRVETGVVAASSRQEIRDTENINRELLGFKKDVERINAIQLQRPDSFGTVQKLISRTSSLVKIKNMEFDFVQKKLVLSGTAPTRKALLDLKDALERYPEYGKVDVPLAALMRENDISFTLSTSLGGK
jgi:hypothetical protein